MRDARPDLRRRGAAVSQVTYAFQQRVDASARLIVNEDLARSAPTSRRSGGPTCRVRRELGELVVDDAALNRLAGRDLSPLSALESVRQLVHAVDVDRSHEAQPMMPMATLSVTEDMATCMRLHAMGWRRSTTTRCWPTAWPPTTSAPCCSSGCAGPRAPCR